MTPEPIKKEELINTEEELALIDRAQKGDKEALTRLININQRFVLALAKEYEGCGLTLDELVGEGNKGLEAACMKYDPKRGFKFFAYAVWWIKESITTAIKTTNL